MVFRNWQFGSIFKNIVEAKTDNSCVWIGLVGVSPREGCELITTDEGAYVSFLTLATSEAEYRAKISGALGFYRLELIEFENIRPFVFDEGATLEIETIALDLAANRNPQHVIFATFHTFPRLM